MLKFANKELSRAMSMLALVFFLPGLSQAESVFDYPLAYSEQAAEEFKQLSRLDELEVLRARVKQVKQLKILSKPFVSAGSIIFARERGLYWQIEQPIPSAYRMDTAGISHIPLPGQQDLLASSPPPFGDKVSAVFQSLLLGDIKALSEIFDIYFRQLPEGWQLGLKPKSSLVSQALYSIEVEGGDYIDRIVILDGAADSTTIVFTELETSPAQLSTEEEQYFVR